MIDILIAFGMIICFFLQGQIYEIIKKVLTLTTNMSLKLLNLLGIQITRQEPRVKVSKKFKSTFKDIKLVRRSKENKKLKSSIHLISLIILSVSLTIVIVNLRYGIVTDFLYSIGIVRNFITTRQSMDTTITALAFSLISFSISKLISNWKETKGYRIAKKEIKEKNKIINSMSSRDLILLAKEKDRRILEQLINVSEESNNNSNNNRKDRGKRINNVRNF